jgi:glycosyltransferase involved in cell wall biosynthesis
MLRTYGEQKHHNRLLGRYSLLVVHSAHVQREYVRQGVPETRIRLVHYPVWNEGEPPSLAPVRREHASDVARLLFLGRTEVNKGGTYFIDALPGVAAAHGGRIEVLFAGDGSDRRAWEERVRSLGRLPSIDVRFSGWLDAEGIRNAFSQADALVVPSLWPEPFGLVGPEAGLKGVPAIAFDVGGISDWLTDGVNGYLAPGRPPTPSGLAEAILRFLQTPGRQELRHNAWEAARRFSPQAHFTALDGVLREVASS